MVVKFAHWCHPLPEEVRSNCSLLHPEWSPWWFCYRSLPIWHKEIEDIIVLKNNKGTEDNRVRKLDYSIQISKLFYARFIGNGEISLFSPGDVPGLYDAFGQPEFDALYEKYEATSLISRKTIPKHRNCSCLMKERAETGRIYIMNIDHCNSHSSFNVPVYMSNLCQEITLPTKPLNHIDDPNGEISLCILSAINVGKINRLEELKDLTDIAVRGLDALIDYQGYPIACAEQQPKHVVPSVLVLSVLLTSSLRTVLSTVTKSLGI